MSAVSFSEDWHSPYYPLTMFNDALVRNFRAFPWSWHAFVQCGPDAWKRVMPNVPPPSHFDSLPFASRQKTFEEELEEKERQARQLAEAPSSEVATDNEEEADEPLPPGYKIITESDLYVSDDSSSSSGSESQPVAIDITSSEDERVAQRSASRKIALLAYGLFSDERKRLRELDDQDDESSSSSSASKRPRLVDYVREIRSTATPRKNDKLFSPNVRYRSPKAHYAFLTDSSSNKARSTGHASDSSVKAPSSFVGSVKRRRDDASDAEVYSPSSTNSTLAKRRRIEAEVSEPGVILLMPAATISRHDKVSNWLAHGTPVAPVPEQVESDSDSASEANDSDYDVDVESMASGLDDETPRFLSTKGCTLSDHVSLPKKAHYAGSDAAEDDGVQSYQEAEIHRYAVPNPGPWA